MQKTLNRLLPGNKAKIIRVSGRGQLRRRIVDMGFVPGVEIEVERFAPLGDPMEIKLMGYHLSLRKEDAANILVEVL